MNIEDIKVGDIVYARDLETGQTVERRVTQVLRNFTFRWIDVEVGSEAIRATPGHRFWVESQNEWVAAANLTNGMVVTLESGDAAVIGAVAMLDIPSPEQTYNLEVAVDHNYFVGRGHALVHNGDGSYILRFGSGMWYAGKGALNRMVRSATRISRQTGDLLVDAEWSPANGTTDSYVQEALRIREAGGIGPGSYNKVNSPGEKILQEILESAGCG